MDNNVICVLRGSAPHFAPTPSASSAARPYSTYSVLDPSYFQHLVFDSRCACSVVDGGLVHMFASPAYCDLLQLNSLSGPVGVNMAHMVVPSDRERLQRWRARGGFGCAGGQWDGRTAAVARRHGPAPPQCLSYTCASAPVTLVSSLLRAPVFCERARVKLVTRCVQPGHGGLRLLQRLPPAPHTA